MKSSPKKNRVKRHQINIKKNEKPFKGSPEKTEERKKIPVASCGTDPFKASAAYDRAISNYEAYYQQQLSTGRGWPVYGYYPDYSLQDYLGTSYPEQLENEYSQAFVEYENTIQSLEQARPDIQTICKGIESLKGRERKEYIKGWKEYLASLIETGKQLMNSLEESIQAISP